MSAVPARSRETLDTIVGLMSAAAIFMSLLAMVNLHLSIAGTDLSARPLRVGVRRDHARARRRPHATDGSALAGVAVMTTVAWGVGMVVAVVTGHPLY